jgi:hypothetical protein
MGVVIETCVKCPGVGLERCNVTDEGRQISLSVSWTRRLDKIKSKFVLSALRTIYPAPLKISKRRREVIQMSLHPLCLRDDNTREGRNGNPRSS